MIVDTPTFTVTETTREWRVQIIWSDGETGPTIAFPSRAEAEIWIRRDAGDWLTRVASLAVL